jgi:taurine dioxygenase
MTIATPEKTTTRVTGVLVKPLSPYLGAVIEGVDGSQPLAPDVVDELRNAILSYKVLFFRNQNLDPDAQAAFAAHFGEPFDGVHAGRFTADYEEAGLTAVTVVPHFHADLMYMEEGPSFSMLQMIELPEIGGDTMWADLDSSYRDLSQPLKDMLEGLTAKNVMPNYYLPDAELAAMHKRVYDEDLTPDQVAQRRYDLRPHNHPLVRRIPETGTKNYWVSQQHTEAINELHKPESDAILAYLFAHQLRPEYVIRWNWSVGDIAFWDHRRTLHSGINDFANAKRRGRRASVGRNTPIPA